MKKKLSSKKCIALILAVVMIITSVPLMMVGAEIVPGSYDPAPKFSKAAQMEGADAWLDDEGNVQVTFPAADAEPTYKGEALSIAFYILELVDMGSKSANHTDKVLDTIKVTGTSGTFMAADIGTIDLENKRYSVTVTAVDTENWFSQPIYTTVTEVPKFVYDAERYQVFTADSTAAREIMTFDSGDKDDGKVTGDVLQYLGPTPQTGVEDDTGVDTYALRFKMYQQPTSKQTFDTSYSRQTWDFAGADEIWFWMDLMDVQLEGISFRLRAQEKEILGWGSAKVEDNGNKIGSIVYSTIGTTADTYEGEDPYVWIQREDGGWSKMVLTNGTFDLGNFKGYVRVPIEFMCSETDAVVTANNEYFTKTTNNKNDLLAHIDSSFPNDTQKAEATAQTNINVDNFFNTNVKLNSVVVDKAGTPVNEALLLQYRLYQMDKTYSSGKYITTTGKYGDPITRDLGLMPALAIDSSLYTSDSDANRATVSADGTVGNRENAYKAIDDLYSAGFSIDGCSSESLTNSFYIDNVVFYRDDGKEWTDLSLSGYDANTGETIYNYYDQETVIATAIFDAIDEYISTPDWADYREIEYILDMIDGYKKAIEEANNKNTNADPKISSDFLSFENLAIKSQELGRKSWQNAMEAYSACLNAGTIEVDKDTGKIICKANASKDQLLPALVNQLEKLPHPDTIVSVSDALREYILEIWRAYSLLNLGQLEMLGEDEEDRILKYIALLDGVIDIDKEEFIVGQSLANRPFILFDDFENYEIGTQSYKLEDALNIYNKGDEDLGASEMYTDYRYTKNLVTYAPETFEDFGGKINDTTNSFLANIATYQPTKNGFNKGIKTKASWATITEEGFQGSKGATMYIDSQFYSSGEGVYNVLSTTYMGAEADNIDALRATGTGNNSVKLGDLAKSFSGVKPDPYLSLVFYVDFTQLTDFNMSATIQTFFDGTLNDFQINMGTNAADQNFFILDGDSGEWVQANNAADAGRMYAFTSKAGADTNGDGVFDVTLAGYKGYVRIPLYHFKPGNNGQKLDESAEALNNIYRVSIGIAPGSAEAAVKMDGNTYTIDNIGFSYDPNAYSDGVASRKNAGITDAYFDEFFGAKSLPVANFEAAVDAIDPYDEATIDAAVANAEALHNALSKYQKGMVEDAYTTLLEYKDYSNDHSTIPQPDVSADSLAEWITNNLTTDATGAKIEGKEYDDEGNLKVDYDLMYPRYKVENGQVVPNYGLYGLTAELAAQLEEFYNESYIHYTVAEKDVVKGLGFLNAYNAAMRCSKSLEDIKQDSVTFLPKITALYDMKYDYPKDEDGNFNENGKLDGKLDDKDDSVANSDEYKVGNFIQIGEKNADGEYEGVKEVSTFKTNEYNPLKYYSKTSIDDGTIYPQLTNTSRAFTYFLNNTREFVVDGETIEGGILTFQKKMQDVYDMADDHIKNRVRFSADELQYVKNILEEYNAFLPAYYNVEELYELEQAIIRLFSVSDIAIMDAETDGSSLATVTLNNNDEESMKDTAYVDLSYIAALLDTTVTLQAVSDLKLTQTSGTTFANLNSFTVDGLTADTPLTLGEYDNLYPDEVFARVPLQIAVDSTIASAVPKDAVYEGSITFNVYETADIDAGLTGADLVPIATLELPVTFTGTLATAYTVTIPAKVQVDWDTTDNVDVSYSVEASLANKKLLVSVEDSGAEAGKLVDSTGTHTLAFTATNFKETTFTGDVAAGTTPPDKPSIKIEQTAWDNVPVGKYSTQLTYTVDVTS